MDNGEERRPSDTVVTLSPDDSEPAEEAPGPGPSPPEEESEAFEESGLPTLFRRPPVGALRNIIATVAVGIIIAGLVWFFDSPGSGLSESVNLTASASGPAPRVGEPAPDFEVQGLDGESIRLSDFRGRPVWINFWATWCPPCRAETPDIQEVYEERQSEGLVIIALSIGEDADTVRGYVERTGTTFTMGLDRDTAVSANYRIVGIPTHFFVDRNGVLQDYRIGSMSKKTMDKKVDAILSSSADREDP